MSTLTCWKNPKKLFIDYYWTPQNPQNQFIQFINQYLTQTVEKIQYLTWTIQKKSKKLFNWEWLTQSDETWSVLDSDYSLVNQSSIWIQ
jgi:hypothetical protein